MSKKNRGLVDNVMVARELVKVAKLLTAKDVTAGDRWEVQQLFGYDWENVWHEDDEPLTFRSKSEAQRELREFLKDVKDSVARGDMSDEYDPRDFRIVRVRESSKKAGNKHEASFGKDDVLMTVLSEDDGKWWSEGTYNYWSPDKAFGDAKRYVRAGYAVVIWKGDTLLGYGGGIDESAAMRYGTGTIKRLTKKDSRVRLVASSKTAFMQLDEDTLKAKLPGMDISEIAQVIRRDWRPVNFAAKPYLMAMTGLGSVNDSYGADDGRMIVNYFLSNASSWRGPIAKLVKKELNKRVR